MFAHISAGFSIFGLNISFYGLLMALAFLVGIVVACLNAKRKNLKSDDLFTLALYVVPLSILGARAYFCIFSNQSFSFLQFFEIWNGGLAILGGVIGGVIAVLIYCTIHKKNLLDIFDIAAPSLLIGQAIGRIGCYFAGCCYGLEVTDPSLWFFPLCINIDGTWHLATMLYESFLCAVGFVVLQMLIKRNPPKGTLLCSYLCIYGIIRTGLEALRFESESLHLFGTGIRVSQALSALLFVGGIIGLILIYTKHKKNNEKVNNS